MAIADGHVVADLWGGEGFERESLVHVYSVTKPMAAFCVLVLVDRGVLALDESVARLWPEFAQARKGSVDGPAGAEPPGRSRRAPRAAAGRGAP